MSLVALAGARIVPGLRGLAGGPLDNGGPSPSTAPEPAEPGSPTLGSAIPGSATTVDQPENGSPR